MIDSLISTKLNITRISIKYRIIKTLKRITCILQLEHDILCKVYQFLITSNIPFSALIMVAIAIDRYFCICHPFLHLLNLVRAKVMSVALAIFATILGIIVSLMYGVYQVKVPVKTKVSLGNGLADSNVTVAYDSIVGTEASHIVDSSTQQVGNSTVRLPSAPGREIIYMWSCAPNEFIVTKGFMWYYQKFYVYGVFDYCHCTVYIDIYISVKQKS